ncbi:OLC1v1023466C1 [Oldenlandia corymbosa var. corymbosa]|uniref:OLC1v1023466C1 n=1 Tax=Oldenlandia corymbosa var. corymbosa TaxID=529605 RepID=A0AAV1C2U7_OLDCO|nr:OLC1v1023466C1 [Oldenlandia corymbosa var. corymbosa]
MVEVVEGKEELIAPLLTDAPQSSSGKSHKSLKRTGTVWTAIAHIITGVIGSGVLSLAWSVAQLGWIAGPMGIIIFGGIAILSSILLSDCYRYPDPEVGHIRNKTYSQAVNTYLGKKSMWVCETFVQESYYGYGIAYTITAAISMSAIQRSNCFHQEGHNAPCEFGDRFYMLLFGAVQILFSQIPNFHEMEWLSVIAAIMSFAYTFIGMGLGAAKVIGNGEIKGDIRGVPTRNTADKVWLTSQAVGDIAFATTYNIILLEIQDTLKSPPPQNQTMKKASISAILVTSFCFLCCGCFGYAAFGNQAPGNILTGFGFYEPYWLVDFANACIVLHLVGGYQVYSQPLFAAAEKWIAKKLPDSGVVNKNYTLKLPMLPAAELNGLRLCFRTTYVVSTTALAMLFPYFNQVLGVLGALNFWPLAIYFPVEMYLSGRGGRGRSRREYPSRFEEKIRERQSYPPSRHLWVGNLSRDIDEGSLAHLFARFGELESIAFLPGRTYAFVNYRIEDDAFAAIEELQGFTVAGNPLIIQFTKAEKSAPQHDDNYLERREENRSMVRGSPCSHRDSRVRHSSFDAAYSDKSKTQEENLEPSEVLWIGFPAHLKVDEFDLRRAFAPFGEIDKITVFPGRPYAFVRFRDVWAACHAKETLQGKLFGNPRVHLCFAKNESGTSHRERNLVNSSSPPYSGPYGHPSENLYLDRDFDATRDHRIIYPRFTTNLEPGDPDMMCFGRERDAWAGKNPASRQMFPEDFGQGVPRNILDSPSKERDLHYNEYSPPNFHHQRPFDDDPFDLPEDLSLFRGAKKLKTSTVNELPEWSDSRQKKHVPSRAYPGFQDDAYEPNIGFGSLSHKQAPDQSMKSTLTNEERDDHLSAPYDGFTTGSVPLSSFPEHKMLTPISHQSSVSKEWKWEGTIAKGGTPVCRARCFPVGQLMDMALPEVLNCTARTSLDMLSKHYYQAAGAWVVFFVPSTDPDIAFYNEFMNYLGEKQRAAVARLDEMNTLFLVPPSDFSEKVLKVPGKLSISGVVLRSEHPGSGYGSLNHHQAKKEAHFTSLQTNPATINPSSSMPALPDLERPGVRKTSDPGNSLNGVASASFLRPGVRDASGNFSNSPVDPRLVDALPRLKSMMGSQNSGSNTWNTALQSNNGVNLTEGYNPVPVSRMGGQLHLEKPPDFSSRPDVAALQPEELIKLASSLLGQQRHPGAAPSMGSDHWAQQNYVPHNQIAPESSLAQYGQMQHFPPQGQILPRVPTVPPREHQPGGSLVNQPLRLPEQMEGDTTEKRLQATLNLAATLLQQIQQGKGT